MLHFIYGPCGSGKTTALYKYLESDIKQGKKAFFIVPEQETVAIERTVASLFPASAQLNIDVLNFSRLCNKIFRAYGGLSYNFATKQIKALIMWNTLRELSPMLEEYNAYEATDFSLTQKMLSAAKELKAYCISPKKLESACERMDEESSAYRKFRDISLIYSAYSSRLEESFDDTENDISKAIKILEANNFFKGANVYLDSFAGFTKQELEFICKIASLCDEIYLTLPITSPNDNSIHYESLRQTIAKIKKHIGAENYDEAYLTEAHRTDSKALLHLQENIWNFEASAFAENTDGDIRAFVCDTPYSESEIIATEILKEVQNGARFNEIAIILRDAEKYKGIIDIALKKYGIPYFMSEKTDLMSKALSKFLFSALKIKSSDWRGSSVIAHLKSGFSDIDPFDVDIFEDYVNTWNINGNKFLGDRWTMNPDGYSERMSARAQKILKTANEVKERLVPTLALYFTRLDASESVKEMCGATLEFLKASQITQKVKESCAENLKAGDKKVADEDMKLYSLTLNILYELSNVLGDERMSIDEFIAALSLMFNESDIGTIPTSADEVTVGSASMLRTGSIKTAFIMGLNEGEFPASVKDGGIFTDSDKELLENLDISLSSSTNIKTSEELFFVYRAISAPSDTLVISCSALSSDGSAQRQSVVIDRVKKLFPALHFIKEKEIAPIDKIWNIESAKSVYPHIKNMYGAEAVREIIEVEGNDQFAQSLSIPLSQKSCKISPQIANELFGKRISLTPSRLEKYVLCGFDYYCSYVLGLRESKRAVFQLNDIGSFIHYILEMFMKEISVDGKLNLTLSDDEIDEILKKTVSNYLLKILGEDYSISNRTRHLFIRLNRLSYTIAKNLIKEFKASDFYPTHFELKVGMGDNSIDPLEFELKDGTKLSLRGIVDRVDTYKKDDKVYIRVVDYKTGSKAFNFSDVKDGLSTQLLIYLFSICYLKNSEQKLSFGCDEASQLLPAGIQYLSSNAPAISLDKFCDGEEIENLIHNEFSRSGLLSDDPEIIRAINHELDPKIVTGAKEDKEGKIVGKGVVGEGGFEEIYDMLSETIIRVAESLKDGNANAIPLKSGNDAPCRYCRMKAICRSSVYKNASKGGKK